MRNVRMIGVEDPFLYKMTGFVAELMQRPYPEMMESVQRVARVVKDEEHRYATTFLVAEKVFNEAIKAHRGARHPRRAFLQALRHLRPGARRAGRDGARARPDASIATAFESEMEQQRERARASWKGAEKGAVVPAYQELLEQGRTKFLGYSEAGGHVARDRAAGGQAAGGAACRPATKAELVLDQTPFYAETGGQVGDHGALYSATGREGGGCGDGVPGRSRADRASHRGARADRAWATCCARKWRRRCAMPRGAIIPPRICCTRRCGRCWARTSSRRAAWWSPGACASTSRTTRRMDRAEIEEVERLMNEQILKNTAVQTDVMPLDQAIATGAMALFGEKYGERGARGFGARASAANCAAARTCSAPAISACARSFTKAASRRACGASRRSPAKARCGSIRRPRGAVRRIAEMVQAAEPELVEHVEKLLATERALEKQVEQLKNKLAQAAVGQAGSAGAHGQGRESGGGAGGRHGPPADARAGRFAAQQVEDRGGGAGRRRKTATCRSSRR